MERIQNKQGTFLTVLFFSSNCYSLLFAAKQGGAVWISYLLAWIIAVAVALLFGFLFNRSDASFFKSLDNLLSRPIGLIFTSFLAIYAFLSACTSLSVFGQFHQLTALSKTPTILFPLAVILLGVLACRSGITAIGRMASLTIWFAVLVFVLFVVLGFNELTPSLLFKTDPFSFKSAFIVFSNQLGDILLLSAVYPHLSQKNSRAMTLGVLLAGGMLFLISLITVMTLGGNGVIGNAYPVFTVLSVRSVGQFVQHPELLTSVAMTIFAFFRTALSLYFIAQALTHIFSLRDGRVPILPIGLLLASTTQLMYHGMPMLLERLESNLSLWILLPIQILLPALLFVILLIKQKKNTPLG